MCGRFNLIRPGNLNYRFQAHGDESSLAPRYNIAPGQQVLIVTNHREMEMVRWGLVPHWAKDAKFGSRTINARAETVATKPAYRRAFRSQRCLIPATGFYEWRQTPEGKIPYHIRLKSGEVFAFAGLYDVWRDEQGHELRTCTIITTSANDFLAPIHARMPVILRRENEEAWLDPKETQPEALLPLLTPYPSEEMEAYPVSDLVNRPAYDVPEILNPALNDVP